MKKITILALGRTGAAPMYSFGMAKALSSYAIIQCIVSSDTENLVLWRQEASNNRNFKIIEVPTYTNVITFIINNFKLWRFKKIIKLINNFKPDVLYSPFNHFWNKFVFPKVNCQHKIITIHDIQMHTGEDSKFRGMLYSFFDYKSEKCIILSEIFRDYVINKLHYEDKNVVTIPHATFDQYSTSKQLDLNQYNTLIFFGRIVTYKGLNVLLEALPIIVEKLPHLKLLIVGNGDMSHYNEQIKKYSDNIETHIKWIQDTEVESFFSRTDIAILPYTEASQSGVIPLANSFGKPCIITNIGGLPAQVIDQVTGIIINPNSPSELADAVISLYSDAKTLKYYKENSFKFAQENNWDKSARLFIEGFLTH